MARRRYTHAEKAKAVAAAEVNGVTQAADSLGIPRKTLEYWVDAPQFADLRQKTREEKRDGYRVLVALAQKRLMELIPSMEPRDLTILLGVSQDKDLLLGGDATTRSEVNTFHGYNDHEKRAVAELIRSAVAGDGPSAGPAGDAEGPAMVGTGPSGADSAER